MGGVIWDQVKVCAGIKIRIGIKMRIRIKINVRYGGGWMAVDFQPRRM